MNGWIIGYGVLLMFVFDLALGGVLLLEVL